MIEIDDRIRRAAASTPLEASHLDRMWMRTAELIEEQHPDVTPVVLQRRRRRIAPRVRIALIVALVLLVLAGIAAAGQQLVRELFDDRAPAPERMQVFREPPPVSTDPAALTDADLPIVPANVQAELDRLWKLEPSYASSTDAPRTRIDPARVLLDDDELGVRIDAAAAREGACFIVRIDADPGGASSCVRAFDATNPISQLHLSGSYGRVVAGLAADEVTAIDVLHGDGRSDHATMGTNAYVWRGPHDDRPTALELQFTNGARSRVEIPPQVWQ